MVTLILLVKPASLIVVSEVFLALVEEILSSWWYDSERF